VDKKIDERLKRIEEHLGIGGIEQLFTYPATGGTATLPKGTNKFDFSESIVKLANGTEDTLSDRLYKDKKVRCIAIETNRDITVYTNQSISSKWTIKAGEYKRIPHQSFTKLWIDTTESTDITLWGHTHPEGLPDKLVVTPSKWSNKISKRLSLSTTENSIDFGLTVSAIMMTYISVDSYLELDGSVTSDSPFFSSGTSFYLEYACRYVYGKALSGTGTAYFWGFY